MTSAWPTRSTRSACSTATAGLPEQVEAAVERGRRRSTGCPTHDDDRERRRARHGRQRHRRRPARRGRRAVHAGAGRRREGLRAARRSSARARSCFAVSFSGNTEETLEAASTAAVAGRHVVVVPSPAASSAELAEAWGAPRHPAARRHPDAPRRHRRAGDPAARRARADRACSRAPASGSPSAVDAAAPRGATSWSRDEQPGRRAGPPHRPHDPDRLRRRRVGAVAALRWKTQVNENAKVPGVLRTPCPELCHNEICGWGQHGDVTRQVFTLVNLRHDHEHPQVMRRFDLVARDRRRGRRPAIDEVRAEGEGALAQLLDLVLFGDFVSLHLACQEGVDPGPDPRPRRDQDAGRCQTSLEPGRCTWAVADSSQTGPGSATSPDRRRLDRPELTHARIRPDFKVADLSPGRLRPQGDRARRARDARPHGAAGRVRRRPAARRAPASPGSLHMTDPDRGAHRDARRPRRRGPLGVAATSSRPRTTPPPPSPSGPTARSTTPGRAGLRVEGRDARGVLVVHRAGAALARLRRRPEHDPRRRRRRHAARAQGRRVRGGRRGPRRQRRRLRRVEGRARPARGARSTDDPKLWTRIARGHQAASPRRPPPACTGSTRWPRRARCCSRRSTSTTRSPSRSSTTSTAAATRSSTASTAPPT